MKECVQPVLSFKWIWKNHLDPLHWEIRFVWLLPVDREQKLHVSNIYPPDAQVVSTGGQQVRVDPLGVGDPHDLGGGVRVVEGVPADELWALLLETHQLNLCSGKHTIIPVITHLFRAQRAQETQWVHSEVPLDGSNKSQIMPYVCLHSFRKTERKQNCDVEIGSCAGR